MNDDEVICPACNGSGEGPCDGTLCYTCRGRGTIDYNAPTEEDYSDHLESMND